MRRLLLIASAAVVVAATPALAKPGHAQGHGAKSESAGKAHSASRTRKASDARRTTRSQYRQNSAVDVNRNGVADYREGRFDRDRDGIDDRAENRYGGAACPPGLAKKTPACMPPGQAKRSFIEGQRVPRGYDYYTDFDRLPSNYQDDIPNIYQSDAYRYIYRDDRIYVVDRTSRIVQSIISQFD